MTLVRELRKIAKSAVADLAKEMANLEIQGICCRCGEREALEGLRLCQLCVPPPIPCELQNDD